MAIQVYFRRSNYSTIEPVSGLAKQRHRLRAAALTGNSAMNASRHSRLASRIRRILVGSSLVADPTTLRQTDEVLAEEEGLRRVCVETLIAAWVRSTPETLRSDLPRQMEGFGLDPGEYRHLLE